jgi:hypothetical protein
VAVEGADLLADHHVDPQLGVLAREVARARGAGHLVVVGDRDHVEPPGGGAHDGLGRLAAVAVERVDVEIGAALDARPPGCSLSRTHAIHHVRACTAGIDRLHFAP